MLKRLVAVSTLFAFLDTGAVNGQTVKAFLDANKVPYKTGGGFFSREKNNADIAEEASKWTVLVECWR